MMYFILGWLAIAFFGIAVYNRIKLSKALDDIEALEIGKDELQDSYEQQFLSHLEKISYLTIRNEELEKDRTEAEGILVYHAERCHGLVSDTFARILEQLTTAHDAPAPLVHNHPLYEGCGINDCKTDRYVDGVHQFTDVTVLSPIKTG